MTKLIDALSLPEDIRRLTMSDLKIVAQELREELINTVSASGGHFASSLGTVELSVALHYVFETPKDKLVWDVGHQAYIHKILTGRRDQMKTIRKKDGLSGFLRREESEYDAFGAGHAGTSISAALGMAEALHHTDPERTAVAIIGDGSITSGMALEALNHTGALNRKLIVVLNDNDMSISPNVGALSWLFSKTVTAKLPTIARQTFKSLHQKGYVPEIVYKAVDRAEEATVNFFGGDAAALFESFGFRYIGPVDGHSLEDLVTALQNAKNQNGPVLIHARTAKGKGFEPAEEDPLKWHGVVPFDPKSATFLSASSAKKMPTYSEAFGNFMIEMSNLNPKVIGITAAMPTGTGLNVYQKSHPDKFYDVAICEQHAVTFAAGMACEGYKPVCAIYSTFLQRAFDQVVHDVCIQNLPVVFAMDRGGVVGDDGHTHQGVFDISYLRCLPNMVLMAPRDENEMRNMLFTAVNHTGPIGIRYPRGSIVGVAMDKEPQRIEIGKAAVAREGRDALIIALGTLVNSACELAEKLSAEQGTEVAVINARFAKPLDQELLSRYINQYDVVCTWEDHALAGGFGSAVVEFVNDAGISPATGIKRFGVGDEFVPHASQKQQHELLGYDAGSLEAWLLQRLTRRVSERAQG
jgi:1-deoxy-D-xylulose-5-phosphate synthase